MTWDIPYRGSAAKLRIERYASGRTTAFVDGYEVESWTTVAGRGRYAEIVLPTERPSVIVAEHRDEANSLSTTVFVARQMIGDWSVTLDAWRASHGAAIAGTVPAREYTGLRGLLWGPRAYAWLAALMSAGLFYQSVATSNARWAYVGVAAFPILTAWTIGVARLVRWLEARDLTRSRIDGSLQYGLLLVVPLVAYGVLLAVLGRS